MKHRRKVMLTFWHIMMITIFISCMALFALVSFWALQPFGTSVVEFPKGIRIEEKEVYQGGYITINAPYCKNVATKATLVIRQFQDDLTYFLPSVDSNVEVGCDDDYRIQLYIPENLPPDTYTYKVTFNYEINHIKDVQYTFETNEFTVLRKLTPETIQEVCRVAKCNGN